MEVIVHGGHYPWRLWSMEVIVHGGYSMIIVHDSPVSNTVLHPAICTVSTAQRIKELVKTSPRVRLITAKYLMQMLADR